MLGECCAEVETGGARVALSHYRYGFGKFANTDPLNRMAQFRFCDVVFEVWDPVVGTYATARSFTDSADYQNTLPSDFVYTPNRATYDLIAVGSLEGRTTQVRKIFEQAIVTEWFLNDFGFTNEMIGRSIYSIQEQKPDLAQVTLSILDGYDFPAIGFSRNVLKSTTTEVSDLPANVNALRAASISIAAEQLFPYAERVITNELLAIPSRGATPIYASQYLCNASKSKLVGSPGYFRTRRKYKIDSIEDDGSGGKVFIFGPEVLLSCVGNQFAQQEFIALPAMTPGDATDAFAEVTKFTTQLSDPCALP